MDAIRGLAMDTPATVSLHSGDVVFHQPNLPPLIGAVGCAGIAGKRIKHQAAFGTLPR
jgi:hypothetical protein